LNIDLLLVIFLFEMKAPKEENFGFHCFNLISRYLSGCYKLHLWPELIVYKELEE